MLATIGRTSDNKLIILIYDRHLEQIELFFYDLDQFPLLPSAQVELSTECLHDIFVIFAIINDHSLLLTYHGHIDEQDGFAAIFLFHLSRFLGRIICGGGAQL